VGDSPVANLLFSFERVVVVVGVGYNEFEVARRGLIEA
jgi:hypothetical protein